MRATNVFFKKWCDDSVPELDEEEIKESIAEHGEYIYDDNDGRDIHILVEMKAS